MAEIEIPVVTTELGEGGTDSGDTVMNHVSHDKTGEEFEDESPLVVVAGHEHDRENEIYLDIESSSIRDGTITSPLVLPMHNLPQGATPLIILPVQSEGIPTSGGLPLGRGDSSSPPTPPNGEELKKVLSQQLEYYFSKDNLSSDKYLLSQMDGDNYVPVSVISHFNQVRKLTTDISLILESLRASSVLQLDEGEEKVRAIPEKRCVLILREIPKETSKQVIVDLFERGNCPDCVTCEFAENNCWYVTFDSETSTQQAFSYLREEVREFLGQPIRARIKGTTVQRSSGMPKAKHAPFAMQSGPFNGGPPQMPYYQAPPTGMLPWSPTPPIASASQFYDHGHGNFNQFVPNGFASPQQGTSNQVGVASQSPAVGGPPTGPPGGFTGPGNRFNTYAPAVRGGAGEGDNREGRGRMGPPNRYNRGGDRGNSPPAVLPNGDVPPVTANVEQRGDKVDHKGARGEHHPGSSGSGLGGGGGGGGGGKYRHDDRKIPRLKNTRYGPRGGQGTDGDRGNEKNQVPPRQQNKQQPKIDLATAHFPPLPTSTSSDSGTTPAQAPHPVTTHTHISSEDGQKTLSDIVKGNGRPITKEPVVGDAPVLIASADGVRAAVASSVVEKSIASAAAKISQSHGSGVSGTTSPPAAVPVGPPPSTISTQQDTVPPPQKANLNSDPSQAPPSLSSILVGKVAQEVVSGSIPAPRVVTSSSIVANGGAPSHQNTNALSNKPTPISSGQKSAQKDTKTKDRPYNKSYARHSDKDKDISSSKPNRNSQVQKGDGKSALTTSNPRNRHKLDKENPKNRPGSGPRPPHTKPSPKSSKKNISPHSSQSPPTLPINSTHSDTGIENNQAADSSTKLDTVSQSGGGASKPEKLSYAQMAQKKNSAMKLTSGGGDADSADGGAKVMSPVSPVVVTTSPALPQSKTVKSTSTGSMPVGSCEGQSGPPVLSKSAPVSPTKLSGSSSSVVRVKDNEI